MNREIPIEDIRTLLTYDPETGVLTWKTRGREWFATKRACSTWNARYAGRAALTADNGVGYRVGSIANKQYLAHRVAWALHFGEWPNVIDHVNGDTKDNRICNLRNTDNRGNSRNLRVSIRNTSGVMGVSRHQNGRWVAQLKSPGRSQYIGIFENKADAIAAREAALKESGFHPNHGRRA